jgi:hypothetical protein
MTLDDLRTSMNNIFNHWVDIETDENGQVIILTHMKVNDNGELEVVDG